MAFDCIQIRSREQSRLECDIPVTPSYRDSLLLEPISPEPEMDANLRIALDCKTSLKALNENYEKYLNSLPQKQKEYHNLVMTARQSANYPVKQLSAPLLLAKQQQNLIEEQFLKQSRLMWAQNQLIAQKGSPAMTRAEPFYQNQIEPARSRHQSPVFQSRNNEPIRVCCPQQPSQTVIQNAQPHIIYSQKTYHQIDQTHQLALTNARSIQQKAQAISQLHTNSQNAHSQMNRTPIDHSTSSSRHPIHSNQLQSFHYNNYLQNGQNGHSITTRAIVHPNGSSNLQAHPNPCPNPNPNINPNLNPNINPKLNANINSKLNPNINPNLNPNINPNLNSNMNPKLTPNINPNPNPNINPNLNPNINPNLNPNMNQKMNPIINPKQNRNISPNLNPNMNPMINPKQNPNINPNLNPNMNPMNNPKQNPNINPNLNPNMNPMINPKQNPNINPNLNPNMNPMINPKQNPNINPNLNPNMNPNLKPIINPKQNPNINPNLNPNMNPNLNPMINPKQNPNINPNINPNMNPNLNPNINPKLNPNINSNIIQNLNPNINRNINPNINPNLNPNIHTVVPSNPYPNLHSNIHLSHSNSKIHSNTKAYPIRTTHAPHSTHTTHITHAVPTRAIAHTSHHAQVISQANPTNTIAQPIVHTIAQPKINNQAKVSHHPQTYQLQRYSNGMCAYCNDYCPLIVHHNRHNPPINNEKPISDLKQMKTIATFIQPNSNIPEMTAFPAIQKMPIVSNPTQPLAPQTVRQILATNRTRKPSFPLLMTASCPQTLNTNNLNKFETNILNQTKDTINEDICEDMPLNLKKNMTEDDDCLILTHIRRGSKESQGSRPRLSRTSSEYSSDSSGQLRISLTPTEVIVENNSQENKNQEIEDKNQENNEKFDEKCEENGKFNESLETSVKLSENLETNEKLTQILETNEKLTQSLETNEKLTQSLETNEKLTQILETKEKVPGKSFKKFFNKVFEKNEESEEEFNERINKLLLQLLSSTEKRQPIEQPIVYCLEEVVNQNIDNRIEYMIEKQEFVRNLTLIRARDLKRKPIAYLNSRHPLNEISRSIYAGIATKKSVLDFTPEKRKQDNFEELKQVKRKRLFEIKVNKELSEQRNDWKFVLKSLDFSSLLGQRIVGVLPQFQHK